MSRARGFSLVELLVALALLALIAVIGYRGLGSLVETEAHLHSEARRWGELAAVMAQIAQDLSLAVARPESNVAGELVITRLGDADAGALQSGPRRVGYRLREGRLEYLVWPSAARAGATPATSPVLENVAALEWRALAADGTWTPMQAPPGTTPPAPRAVEAQIVLVGGARVTRVFVLP